MLLDFSFNLIIIWIRSTQCVWLGNEGKNQIAKLIDYPVSHENGIPILRNSVLNLTWNRLNGHLQCHCAVNSKITFSLSVSLALFEQRTSFRSEWIAQVIARCLTIVCLHINVFCFCCFFSDLIKFNWERVIIHYAECGAIDAIHRNGKCGCDYVRTETVIAISTANSFSADNYNENVENGFDTLIREATNETV